MIPAPVRHALRALKRTPVFTAAATLTLVLGVGSITAMFAVAHGVMFKPLPYGSPGRLVSLSLESRIPETRRIAQPASAYFTYQRFNRTLADIGFYRTGSANITGDDANASERVQATWVTPSTFATLGVPALLGRTFTAEEDRRRGTYVVVIDEAMWRNRFGGARDVIGKTIVINSLPREIVGVMPSRFRFPAPSTRVWLTTRLDSTTALVGDFAYSAVARLRDGATPEQAETDITAVLPRMSERFARLESGTPTQDWISQVRPRAVVTPLLDDMTGGIARTLWILSAAATLVLLVAVANVANLMLIRADGRQHELAIREALGASRVRVMAHFASESLVLAAAAAAIGLVVAWAGVRALVAFGPPDVPRLAELGIDPATIVFTLIVATVVVIVSSAVPAVRARASVLTISLRDGARGGTASKTRRRLRSALAAAQISVALVLLAGSTLLLRTFHSLYQVEPGFDGTNVATVWVQLPFARYGSDTTTVSFFARLTASVAALPGVRSVGVTSRLPLGDGETLQRSFKLDGDSRVVSLPAYTTDSGYFTTMRIPLIAGRGFGRLSSQRDDEVIVSRRAAEVLWHDPTGRTAIGKRLSTAPVGPSYTVIGVAGDVRDRDLATAPAATIYVPQAVPIDATLEPAPRRSMALVVRTASPGVVTIAPIRDILRRLDPSVPPYDAESMSDVLRASTARLSLTLTLMSAAAVITLLLGGIGLYGVVAYDVALRTREFGVRVALGADPARLAALIVGQGLSVVATGIITGLVLFAMTARLLRSFLYGVTAGDPITLVTTTLAVVVVASLANWIPARRAARVDPADALRSD